MEEIKKKKGHRMGKKRLQRITTDNEKAQHKKSVYILNYLTHRL